MADPIATTLSTLALGVSAVTAWLTLFRRGTLRMTQPTVVFFGPDAGRPPEFKPHAKVYLRALLFATSKRGRVIESMHARLSRGESRQNFNIWVYGDDKLVRGSGMYVGETGVATNHHFLLPEDAREHFVFAPGAYHLDVFARILGEKRHRLLFSHIFEISESFAKALRSNDSGVYFDWGPDSMEYAAVLDRRPSMPLDREAIAAAIFQPRPTPPSANLPNQP